MGVEETTFYYCSSSVLQRRRPRRQRPLQRLKPPPLASFLFTRLSPDYLSVICKKLLTDRGTGGQKQGIPFHFNFRVKAKNRISGGDLHFLACLSYQVFVVYTDFDFGSTGHEIRNCIILVMLSSFVVDKKGIN